MLISDNVNDRCTVKLLVALVFRGVNGISGLAAILVNIVKLLDSRHCCWEFDLRDRLSILITINRYVEGGHHCFQFERQN